LHVFTPAFASIERVWLDCMTGLEFEEARELHRAGIEDTVISTGIPKANLVYGEIGFFGLAEIFCTFLDMRSLRTFYDIGSGSGGAVFAAALLHNFTKLCGIEIISNLAIASRKQLDLYRQYSADFDQKYAFLTDDRDKSADSSFHQDISFISADFQEVNCVILPPISAESSHFSSLPISG
jgi:hypothetical protein